MIITHKHDNNLDKAQNPIVNPVRNSSGALNPALRGGTPYGAEPGIILKKTPLQPPAQRASLRGMSPSGAEPGSERAAGHYF